MFQHSQKMVIKSDQKPLQFYCSKRGGIDVSVLDNGVSQIHLVWRLEWG